MNLALRGYVEAIWEMRLFIPKFTVSDYKAEKHKVEGEKSSKLLEVTSKVANKLNKEEDDRRMYSD